ncbi:MAG: succinyl-diaminopimelate desuccinylase [Gammaproteobacteria bacterium RIFCSPHIGHO2_12_FULL_45_12]|nr:MAG: succinyl-diaminopimelate desuccinylase [Gammaproteobacteria bacterium RIFCSPHIGHO2_12_FULL_45_12]
MNDLITLAQDLLACPSVTPDDAGCQDILKERLARIGFHCESLRFGDVDNLWARYGTEAPLLVFAGHTDVVPPGPLEDWTSPPFAPEIRDGFLYGRGAADMKGAIAAMVIAVETFIQSTPHFSGSLAFLITSDEEGPAHHGTQKVMEQLQQRGIQIDGCIVGEPSSEQVLGDQIRVGRRGSLHGKLTVHGKQGHVAHPHLAINPIHQSVPALTQLTQTVWDQGNEVFPQTTFQITNLHGGTGAANVIPGHLDVLFNLRFSTVLTVEALKQRVQDILDSHELCYHIQWTIGALPFLSSRGHLTDTVQAAIHTITEQHARLSTGGGTSDARFIVPTGAEVVELGVLHTTAHQVDECVSIKDLEYLMNIYLKVLERRLVY